MRKTKEILRLALNEGLAQREIALSTGVGKTTVQEIVARAKQAGLEWTDLQHVHEPDIVSQLYPRPQGAKVKKDADWPAIDRELKKKGNTLSLLWLDDKEENPDGMGYSSFCEHYRQWKKSCGLTMRQHHPAGKRFFVDFSGLTVPWLDLESGEMHEAEIFVAVLGASNLTFVRAVKDQSSASWLDCHVRCLTFIGGVPETIVPDNLRSGVSRACRYDPDTNPAYQWFAEHYGTAIIPARAYKPRDKAKAEVGVQVAQRWILAILRRQTFTSIAEINIQIQILLEKLNNRIMKHLGTSRRQLFEEIEREALKPLAPIAFSFPAWKIVKVSVDYHIEFERHYYSVPHSFVGKSVDIKATVSTVEIFEGGKRIAIHQRYGGRPGRHTTLPEHMPASHRAHAEWTPERILQWAEESGSHVVELCRRIMEGRPHPEQGFRSCLGILRLGKNHGQDRLDKACEMAISMKSLRYRTIQDILRSGSDRKVRILKPTKPAQIQHHENIRGADYYN
jgi:transposase